MIEDWATLLAGGLCAYVCVRADLRRRNLRVNALLLVVATEIAGLIGALLFVGLAPSFSFFFEHAELLWLPGMAGGLIALVFLARHYKIPWVIALDLAATAATIGFAASRAMWLLIPGRPYGATAGDAITALRYSATHMSLYRAGAFELVAGLLIFWFLWREGRAAMQWQRPNGIVAGEYLVLTGVAWALIPWLSGVQEFFPGSAQVVGAALVVLGGGLLAVVLTGYVRRSEGHRILEHVAAVGEAVQPEYTPATRECPHPERWRMYDSYTAEVEVLDFLRALITTVKPNLVVETGTFSGISAIAIAEGLRQNGFGKVITCEYDPATYAKAKDRIEASPVASWIECRNASSLEMTVEGEIDILFSDSEQNIRAQEVRRFLPQMNPHGLILIHDANSHINIVRAGALRLEQEGLISVVLVPTPRGLVIAQKRAGRQ
jgi:predicted O-methyltransferase YrrM